jgi:hypothetical protein
MSALTITELHGYLARIDISVTFTELRRQLFLLAKVNLLKIEAAGDQRFYVVNDSREFITLYSAVTGHFDKSRFRSDVISHYKRSDKKRFRALQRARGSEA